ncbi:MAG: anthranilate phosphoribosyltransferase [Bacteroidota bacterium]
MIKSYLEKVIEKEDLSFQESGEVMDRIMSGSVNNSQLSGFLTALKSKGETPEEIAGFARIMQEKSIRINTDTENLIDVCGTGGDYSGTFNISTATAFAAAGAGIKVAKHGNRSISSKCGSADVLSELGINIHLQPSMAERSLEKTGIAFLFAPDYHPAMKHAASARRELNIKTIFNLLGPLTNPASPRRQLIGVFSNRAAKTMAHAAAYLDMQKVCFLSTCDKFDEISLTGMTDVYEFSAGENISHYNITPETFGYNTIRLTDIQGNSPADNAAIITDLFTSRKKNAAFYVTSANTAFALYCAGYSDDIDTCRLAAEDSILSGKAFEKLNELRKFGESAA